MAEHGPPSARSFLGVDGGSSGTRALLIDEHGRILGAGHGGNANHAGQGFESAVGNVMAAVRQAADQAGIALREIAAGHFALAGDDVVDDHVRLVDLLAGPTGGMPFQVSNDVWAGLRAGSVQGHGIAINCGSGAGAVARTASGASAMIPDLGYQFGDSGGGVQIGMDAFRAVIRAWDGRGQPTALTRVVLDLTGQPDTAALYLALYRGQVGSAMYRKCTRLVFQVAAEGDAVAIAILKRIGEEFGLSASALARRLHMEEQEFPFVLTGGSVRTLRSPLAESAVDRLRGVAPRSRPTLPLLMPVAGAALLAMDAGGGPVTPEHFQALKNQGLAWHPQETFDKG